jgi:hypothetical protein
MRTGTRVRPSAASLTALEKRGSKLEVFVRSRKKVRIDW